ncbi:MAG: hypothetical protein HC795_15705, partial [Coleofasciculaceae cyanobacterium RL_1_1]|nr:hypothetical protein [Coleofasciculaceae cyanobacterium RL_1_1]
ENWSQSLQVDRGGRIVGIRDRQPCVLVVDGQLADVFDDEAILACLDRTEP